MKQHIEPKQLDELTPDGKEKLRDWWQPREGDHYCDTKPPYHENTYWLVEYDCMWHYGEAEDIDDFTRMMREENTLLPLLSIGQMIEYLATRDTADDWQDICKNHPAYELCDGLWEAVKETLEQ